MACEEFQEQGGVLQLGYSVVDPWRRMVSNIYVPPVELTCEMEGEIAILHPIARRANTVLRVRDAVRADTQEVTALQKAVHRYYEEVCRTLFGKGGVYNRFILGPRMQRSFRAVIVPGRYKHDPFGDSYEWVGVPHKICRRLNVDEGDYVIIGRDPTIWSGSLEILKAYPVDHDSIEIHPLLLPQLGGDHDGDQVWGAALDIDMDQEEYMPAGFTRRHATWNRNLTDQQEDNVPQWGKGGWDIVSFKKDEAARVKTTGLSVSPLDIVEQSPALERVLTYCGKGTRARGRAEYGELEEAIDQPPMDKWLEFTRMVNMAQLAMKVYMGPVGLLSLRLVVIGNNWSHLTQACDLLAERCSQSLLDAKHLSYEDIGNFKPARVFEVLNLQDDEVESVEDMFNVLKGIVGCDERVMPILQFIWEDERGLARLSKEEFPLFEGITFTGESAQGGYVPPMVFDPTLGKSEGIFTHAFEVASAAPVLEPA